MALKAPPQYFRHFNNAMPLFSIFPSNRQKDNVLNNKTHIYTPKPRKNASALKSLFVQSLFYFYS